MIDKVKDTCCGCGACASVCPKHCITMENNDEGFLYPVIDASLCINCNRCETLCPVLHTNTTARDDLREAWAAIAEDQCVLLNSSSGGLFTELASVVISDGGCVFGASFSDDYYAVRHVMAETAEGLSRLRGSKYVQSEMGECYIEAKRQLATGRSVLFSGTACQIAGLKRFLGKSYDNLVCVDVICHGTPSPLLWSTYLKHIETEMGGKAKAVSFRHKQNGWRLFGMNMPMSGDKHYYKTMQEDPFMQMFLKNYCLRESCYHCSIKESGAASDITIGDYWGVERIEPDMDSSMGVSLALIHTQKGKQLFERVKAMMQARQTDYDKAIVGNSAYDHSVNRPQERDRFFADLKRMGWDKFEKKYTREKLRVRIRRRLSASIIGEARRALLNRSEKLAKNCENSANKVENNGNLKPSGG